MEAAEAEGKKVLRKRRIMKSAKEGREDEDMVVSGIWALGCLGDVDWKVIGGMIASRTFKVSKK